MDKQLFDDAIGEVPPSTVDVDAAIARGRRAARVRRVANPAVAAGAAVVLLTGAVAYTMTRDDDGGATVGTAPPPATSSTSSTAPPPSGPDGQPVEVRPTTIDDGRDEVPPPQCEEDDQETASEAAARLTSAAIEAVSAQRPDVQLVPNPSFQNPHGPLEFYQARQREPGKEMPICDPAGQFEAMATTQAPDGAGNILFVVRPDWYPEEEQSCARGGLPNTVCEVATGPDGEEIVKQTGDFGSGTVMNRVAVVRPDGTWLLVQAENIATSSKFGTAATATAPPLTLDQLVTIAIDPDLGMFP